MANPPTLVFSPTEFARRSDAVQRAMRALGVDVLIVDECEALGYLTGTANTLNLYRACVFPAAGAPTMLLRQLDAGPLR